MRRSEDWTSGGERVKRRRDRGTAKGGRTKSRPADGSWIFSTTRRANEGFIRRFPAVTATARNVATETAAHSIRSPSPPTIPMAPTAIPKPAGRAPMTAATTVTDRLSHGRCRTVGHRPGQHRRGFRRSVARAFYRSAPSTRQSADVPRLHSSRQHEPVPDLRQHAPIAWHTLARPSKTRCPLQSRFLARRSSRFVPAALPRDGFHPLNAATDPALHRRHSRARPNPHPGYGRRDRPRACVARHGDRAAHAPQLRRRRSRGGRTASEGRAIHRRTWRSCRAGHCGGSDRSDGGTARRPRRVDQQCRLCRPHADLVAERRGDTGIGRGHPGRILPTCPRRICAPAGTRAWSRSPSSLRIRFVRISRCLRRPQRRRRHSRRWCVRSRLKWLRPG